MAEMERVSADIASWPPELREVERMGAKASVQAVSSWASEACSARMSDGE